MSGLTSCLSLILVDNCMASTGSKGNRQFPCFGYLAVFHAFTLTRAFGVRPQSLIFAFDTPLKRLFDRLRSMFSGAVGCRCRRSSVIGNRQQVTPLQAWRNFFLHFFSRLFVDRNAMVVSLQREKVTGKPPYLHPISTLPPAAPANRRRWRRTSAGKNRANLRGHESSRLDAAFARRRHKKRN